jgi:hypothetical protein
MELTGGQDAMTHGGGLLLGSFNHDDQAVELLLEDLDVGDRKGDDVRWHDYQRRGGGGGINSTWVVAPRSTVARRWYHTAREHCSVANTVAQW